MSTRERPNLSIAICFISIVTLSASLCAQNLDWPRWRGPNGNSISTESQWDPNALAPDPKILWRAMIFCRNDRGDLACVDLRKSD